MDGDLFYRHMSVALRYQDSNFEAPRARRARRAPAGKILRFEHAPTGIGGAVGADAPESDKPKRGQVAGNGRILTASSTMGIVLAVSAVYGFLNPLYTDGVVARLSVAYSRAQTKSAAIPNAAKAAIMPVQQVRSDAGLPRFYRSATLGQEPSQPQELISAERIAPVQRGAPIEHAPVPQRVPVDQKLQGRLAAYTVAAAAGTEGREVLVAPRRAGSSGQLVARVHSIVKKYAPRHKYPALLAEAIVRESVNQGYDPLFVAAVIKSESAFNANARSNKGAQGLMQIMPATGAWLAKQESLPRGNLTMPGRNLKLGIKYLKSLEEEYEGNRVFTLVAYNWGPGHLDRAQNGGRRVPAECLSYAVRILNDYRRWKSGVI